MYGFDNIHIAKLDKNGYSIPVHIEGAKAIEAEFKYDTTTAKSDKNNIRFTNFIGGSGSLTVIGLTPEEYGLLFGNMVDGNRFTVKETDISSNVALMFSRRKSTGENIGYCIYKVNFKPIGISATTMENGAMAEESIEIEFEIESNNGDIYYFDDCDDSFFDSVR